MIVNKDNRCSAIDRTCCSPTFHVVILGLATFFSSLSQAFAAAESFCPEGNSPSPNVIWCDSFEDSDLGPNGTVAENYFEFDVDNGDHARGRRESPHGEYSLRVRWQAGEVDAGHFIRNFGRNPIGSQSHQQTDFTEIYWRFYMKLQNGFVGHPDKVTRATIFAGSNWQQAMIAHLWADEGAREYLMLDPTSGINNQGQLVTTEWNDFDNLIWLGGTRGVTPLQPNQWYCVEAHVKLNSPNQQNGIFEYWINDNLEARRANLDWVKTWADYGINSILFSSYWNGSSPRQQERYLDAIVISKARVGCLGSTRPNPPSGLLVQ